MQALWPDKGCAPAGPWAQGLVAVFWHTIPTAEAAAQSALCHTSQHLAGLLATLQQLTSVHVLLYMMLVLVAAAALAMTVFHTCVYLVQLSLFLVAREIVCALAVNGP